MPVVINEVEVVDTPNESEQPALGSESPAPHNTLLREEDLARMLDEIHEHALRMWSH